MSAPLVPSHTSPCKGEVVRAADGRGSRFSRTTAMTKNARRLRRNSTDVEQILWKAIRRNQIGNTNFRRQHPVGRYVLDFYAPSAHLAIELDGGQHALPQTAARDQQRSTWLANKGIRTLRFWNNDVTSNLSGVLQTVSEALQPPSRREDRADLPLSGGGEHEGLS